mmetsp:Transcript_22635/g.39816  ORF Transcript_22635/g.39816 Transcript_22635/m.39816 type:complete len:646 (+) Transcript_22635:59-1996(+)
MRWSTPVRHDDRQEKHRAPLTSVAFNPDGISRGGVSSGPIGRVRQNSGTPPPGTTMSASSSAHVLPFAPSARRSIPAGTQSVPRFARLTASNSFASSSTSEPPSSVSMWRQVGRSDSPVTFVTPRPPQQASAAPTPRVVQRGSHTSSESGGATPPIPPMPPMVQAQVFSKVAALSESGVRVSMGPSEGATFTPRFAAFSESGASTPSALQAQVLSKASTAHSSAAHSSVGSLTVPKRKSEEQGSSLVRSHSAPPPARPANINHAGPVSSPQMTSSSFEAPTACSTAPGAQAAKALSSVTKFVAQAKFQAPAAQSTAPGAQAARALSAGLIGGLQQISTSSLEVKTSSATSLEVNPASLEAPSKQWPGRAISSASQESQAWAAASENLTLEERVTRLENARDELVLKIRQEVMSASNAFAKAIEDRLMQQMWDMRKEICEELRAANSADVSTATPEFAPKGLVTDAGPAWSPRELLSGDRDADPLQLRECIVGQVKLMKDRFAHKVGQDDVDELKLHASRQTKDDDEVLPLQLPSVYLATLQEDLRQAMDTFKDGMQVVNGGSTETSSIQNIADQALKISEFLAQELAQERNQRTINQINCKQRRSRLDERFQTEPLSSLGGHDASSSFSWPSDEAKGSALFEGMT